MENEQWHLDRLNGIGGSEAAIILGISPFKSSLELWEEKVMKNINFQDNLIFDIGHALEPIIAEKYSKMTGRGLVSRPIKYHPDYPWMFANIDREIVKSERKIPGILEIKTRGAWVNWNDEIPDYYNTQIQHYMCVYNYEWASFAVLDLSTRTITYTDVEKDEELIQKLIEEESKFWNLVQTRTLPKVQGNKACENYLKRIFNKSEPITIDISDDKEATKYAEKLKHIKDTRKGLEESEVECKTFFMNLMKNAEKVIGNGYVITWKNDKDKVKFNEDKFKEDNPSLYSKYLEEKKGSKRFLIKF